MENGGIVPLMITLTALLFIAGLVHAATRRLRAPYTIGLVAAGLALGLVVEALPFSLVFPRIRLTPDVMRNLGLKSSAPAWKPIRPPSFHNDYGGATSVVWDPDFVLRSPAPEKPQEDK